MTRIAHLTDVHLDGTAERRRRFEIALAQAARSGAHLLLLTGDLTASGEASELAELSICLRPWPSWRLVVVPGNHDVGPRPWAETLHGTPGLERLASTSAPGAVTVMPDAVVLAIDTQFRRRAPIFGALGKVSAEQLSILETLARPQDVAVIVAMHHPPQRSPLQPFDGLINHEEVARLAGPHVSFLCGHDHRSLDVEFGPGRGRIFVAPSVAEADDPLRVYDVRGTRLVSVKAASAGQYMRGMLPF